MRKFLMTTAMLVIMTGAAQAETIKASVNGMVCGFCATGIEKTFRKQPAVNDIKVDLDSKLVTIQTKPNQKLDDATITQLLANSGYTVTHIHRQG